MALGRAWLGWASRLVLVLALAWALTAPLEQPPKVVNALQGDGRFSPETGFSVAPGAFDDYFRARGGLRTFGPPVSNRFRLLGQDVQLFRYFALRQNPDGSITTLPLLDIGAIPSSRIGGQAVPPADPQLTGSAPVPGTPEYDSRAQAFIRANAPDTWEGLQVGFYAAFLSTVTFQEAFPNGVGNRDLLPGFAQEVWGLPVSRPTRDSQGSDAISLRWERGVMRYDRANARVAVLPLAELFKAVLTGENVPADLAAAAEGSRFYRQLDPRAPNGVARPGELPETTLLAAFQSDGQPSAGVTPPPRTPSPSPTSQPGSPTSELPTTASPTPTDRTRSVPGAGTPTPGASGDGSVSGSITAEDDGPDACYGDEVITFAPENPRVGTELVIVVTSSRPHPYGRLAGTERTTFVRERRGQLGLVWEWTVNLSTAGRHDYTFYVDSTIPCKRVSIEVRSALGTTSASSTGLDNDNLDNFGDNVSSDNSDDNLSSDNVSDNLSDDDNGDNSS
jgi:hypothetical protein